ncbi:putative polypeptide N-acetylgalactosaminyltransferase 9 [Gigantopelta aegis]|uniref:putative polypeptide N-acetylgalactosaminyltransferase 9 n=1 Tax=Gigantopelta aegis TaxID=1735272 RepID=UPI001B888FB8|nr:putative polypeptide N-acetylgalactosaminyltransferase 9 [Gigantopelta aegis]
MQIDIRKAQKKSMFIDDNIDNYFGYLGRSVLVNHSLLSANEKLKFQEGWTKHGFNQYVSDLIPVQRRLPDFRLPACVEQIYPNNLPTASVVIPFHNEALSTLLRTVHSILDNSPPHLLREIVLVDDCSELEINFDLESILSKMPLVKLIKTSTWTGLVGARLTGYDVTSSDVTVFLDSHCEVTTGWLEPILARLKENEKAVVTSAVDVISGDTFEYQPEPLDGFIPVGSFDWNLNYVWNRNYLSRNSTQPVRTATLLGCIIAVSNHFFDTIGRFDAGLSVWGGENLELSFKTWMCGGSVEIIPCSRIGHVFRKYLPYISGQKARDMVKKNLLRVADVWMDDYKFYYHHSINHHLTDIGDTSSMKSLRQALKCSSFQDYLQRLQPLIFIPAFCIWSGQIENHQVRLCIDTDSNNLQIDQVNINVRGCADEDPSQLWFMCERGEIRNHRGCWANYRRSDVILKPCSIRGSASQIWQYREDKSLFHSRTRKCLELTDRNRVVLSTCQLGARQVWTWSRRPAFGPIPPWRSHSYG